MSTKTTCLLALLGAVVAAGAEARAKSPVEKVVQLLEELKGKIATDGKEDHRLYGKYMCWCEKTVKRRAVAIVEAQAKLRELGQLILKYKAQMADLSPDVNSIKIKIALCDKSIDELTAIRTKGNAAYLPEVAELMQALAALEKAIIVLHDATKPALMQSTSSSGAAWRAAASEVRAAIAAMPASAALSPERETEVAAFLQGASRARDGLRYAPQSATIQGILKDMYDSFALNLEELSMAEAAKNKEYESVIFLKYKEKGELEEEMGHSSVPETDIEVLLADTQSSYGDWEAELQANAESFDQTKRDCEAKHKEYHEREKEREDELSGIDKALQILTGDDARELFAKAIKPGQGAAFLQVDSAGSGSQVQMAVTRAYEALKAQATEAHSLRLASLAVAVRVAGMGKFDKVIQAIDNLIGVMKAEEADDVAKRDQCKAEYQKVASEAANLEWEVERNWNRIHKLEALIEKREEEKVETLAHIDVAKAEIVAMEDQRKQEHQAFVEAKSDDEKSIELLAAAKAALMAYFEKHQIPLGPIQASVKEVLLAKEPYFVVSEDQAPDATFSNKASHRLESKGVVSILAMIIEDLHVEIANGLKDEVAAEAEFEKGLATAKKLVTELEGKVVDITKTVATRKAAWVGEHELLGDNKDSLAKWGETKRGMTPDCDWILGAFEERRRKRQAELDALAEAKGYLAGAATPSLLQGHFSRPSTLKIRFGGLSLLGMRG